MAVRALPLIIIALSVVASASAQQDLRRFEVGAQTTMFRTLGQTSSCAACPKPQWSAGPAATFNLSQNFALDGAFTFWPGPSGNPSGGVGGNLTQMLLGLKASVHGSRFSLFATLRPGYVRWSHGQITNVAIPVPGGPLVYSWGARTNFVTDFGGGVQYALTSRVGLRIEMADTVMWWHRYGGNPLDPFPLWPTTSNNLRAASGVFYRFGAPVAIDRPPNTNPHRFFDKWNIALFSAGLLAQTANSITTQRRVGNCRKHPTGLCLDPESNPLARPFVVRGWEGQIAGDMIVEAAEISAAFGLHKMRHHRIERFVTIPVTALNAHYAYQDLQQATR